MAKTKGCYCTGMSMSLYMCVWISITQVPNSDVITSLCGISSVSEEWMMCVYVNGGESSIGDVYENLIF